MDVFPENSVLSAELENYSYADSYEVALTRNDVQSWELVAAFFAAAPAWVDYLFKLRNLLVTPFGLKTGDQGLRPVDPPFHVGQQISVFRILHLDEHEVVLGEDDKHLDFRTSLRLQCDGEHTSLAVSSLVNTKNRLGVLYFTLVKPFHRMIVPVVARGMMRRLSAEGAKGDE
ncbi:MAG: DUF2867 domain-containing protein [Pseudomonadota bacterium]